MIYFDNSATTPLCEEAINVMKKELEQNFYNPSAIYKEGVDASRKLESSRELVAKALKCHKRSVVFTSGGTESINAAIRSAVKSRRGKHIVTSAYEHPATLETVKELEKDGYEVSYLFPAENGCISPFDIGNAIREDTVLVSIMGVNNEVGFINDIPVIGKTIKSRNPSVLFHVDEIQGFLKRPLNAEESLADFISMSGHKIHGPKGVGALYVKEPENFKPLIFGGGQEKNLRSGTENTIGIYGFGAAVAAGYSDLEKHIFQIREIKDFMQEKLNNYFNPEEIRINSSGNGVCHILNVSFLGIKGEILLHTLEGKNLLVSTGSACSSKKSSSHVLSALKLSDEAKEGAIRFSFSRYNTLEEVETAAKIVWESVSEIKKWMPNKRKLRR